MYLFQKQGQNSGLVKLLAVVLTHMKASSVYTVLVLEVNVIMTHLFSFFLDLQNTLFFLCSGGI